MDESALVKRCINGDQKAQQVLFDRFAPKMLAVCIRYAKDVVQAEDVLQNAFIKVFTKLDSFNGGSLEGWIRRIMVNTALDEIRKNKKRTQNVTIDAVEFKVESNNFIVEELQAEDLMKIISCMPEGYKVVFNMFAIEGYSHKEIAEQLEISENTSKSQYSRAKAYLRAELERLGIER